MKNGKLDIAKEVFDIEAASILRLKDLLTEDFNGAVRTVLESSGRLILCGIGKSGNIAQKISATLASTGTPTLFMHPADAIHGDLGLLTKKDVLCAISYSGETDEIIRLIPYIKGSNKIIAITGNETSTLSKNSDFVLNINVEKEACPLQLAPTSSTTATLAMGDALAVALMNARNFKKENFAKFHPGGSLGKKLLTNVGDVMKSVKLPIIGNNTNLKQIISTMTSGRLGIAIVCENDRIDGIITDGDLRRAIEKIDFEVAINIRAKDIMSKEPKTIDYKEKLSVAEEIMNNNKISSLLVTSEKKLVGVIQIYDINF